MYNNGPKNRDNKQALTLKTLSHDLNNILHNILTSIELLKDKINDPEYAVSVVNNIEQNTVLASDILNQFSTNNTTDKNEKSQVSLNKLVIETTELVGRNSKNLIILEGLKKEHFIWGNFTDIKRVILNLIKNAREATTSKSLITIKLDSYSDEKKQELSRIVITDNGIGIHEDNLKKLYEDGFSTKSGSEPRGLGLSIVKSIVDDHNGFIDVNSKLGEGTVFKISFPSYKNDSVSNKFENKKVMIAEDDEFQREVLKDLLKSLKFKVFTASNGIEALELFASTKPDLLFIDDNMPGMTGLECTRKIKELKNNSPIILVTGSNFSEYSLGTGVSKVLKKPYSFEMVESTIHELL